MEKISNIENLRAYILNKLSPLEKEQLENYLLKHPEDIYLLEGLLNLGCDAESVDSSSFLLYEAKLALKKHFLEIININVNIGDF